uniref:Uncharacterized protein n=1 Tax=Cucumis melo TaxID=3656 RepID=A0A9I9CWW1_CUCME
MEKKIADMSQILFWFFVLLRNKGRMKQRRRRLKRNRGRIEPRRSGKVGGFSEWAGDSLIHQQKDGLEEG